MELSAFPRERTWLLPALLAQQRAEGWLSGDAIAAVAAHLRVPASEAWGVATHYPELRLERPGRRLVRVCTGLACRLRGGRDVLAALEARLGVRAGATTAGGEVTLEGMDCAFACGVAPVVVTGHAPQGRVTPAAAGALLTATAHAAATLAAPDAAPALVPGGQGSPTARLAALARGAHAPVRLAVGLGSCGLAVGAATTFEALRAEVARRRLAIDVVAAGCGGACWAAPAVTVCRAAAPPAVLGPVAPAEVGDVLDALDDEAAWAAAAAAGAAWLAPQRRVLLEHCGVVDPGDIGDALRRGAYASLARRLEDGSPERVIEEVRAAGLAGRGGAYFQTAVKWAAARAAAGEPKYVVMNGEEGEPGIVKDRHLMEGDPHLVLEGVLLAALAVGATRAILYVHGEADLAAARMEAAVNQARACGLVGAGVLGSAWGIEVELRRGAGGFVLGEETALLESIEGRRAMPRPRPPFPVEAGLWGRPTVINNAETLAAVPRILALGGGAWAALGGGHGTKLFGLAGHVRRPGVVEMEAGCTLRTLIGRPGGGTAGGGAVRAVVVGGPSGSVVPPRLLDEPLLPRGAVNPGTGGVAVLEEGDSVRDAVETLLGFNARESCGKCTPCREGTVRLLEALGGPPGALRTLAEVVQAASLCGLGQAAPLALLSGLREFPGEFGPPAGR